MDRPGRQHPVERLVVLHAAGEVPGHPEVGAGRAPAQASASPPGVMTGPSAAAAGTQVAFPRSITRRQAPLVVPR